LNWTTKQNKSYSTLVLLMPILQVKPRFTKINTWVIKSKLSELT